LRKLAALAAMGSLWSEPAVAHKLLEGIGDFYAGLLHPVVVPSEVLVVAAVGLLLGVSGLAACRYGIPALGAGLAAGLVVFGEMLPADLDTTTLLLLVSLAAALSVATGLKLSPIASAALGLIGGLAIGLDARPEVETTSAMLVACGATIVGGAIATSIVSVSVLGRKKFWQTVAARIAGSWITAITILYFAWQMAALSK
jgi:urease accessory protein